MPPNNCTQQQILKPFLFEFELEKQSCRNKYQEEKPFFVQEKQLRMKPKHKLNNEYIFTFYIPKTVNTISVKQQPSKHLFKMYSYRSYELPSELKLEQTIHPFVAQKEQPQQPTPPSSSPVKIRDSRYSFDTILHYHNIEINATNGYNPFPK